QQRLHYDNGLLGQRPLLRQLRRDLRTAEDVDPPDLSPELATKARERIELVRLASDLGEQPHALLDNLAFGSLDVLIERAAGHRLQVLDVLHPVRRAPGAVLCLLGGLLLPSLLGSLEGRFGVGVGTSADRRVAQYNVSELVREQI